MIQSAWAYVGLLLLCAGLFPFLEKRMAWRIFRVLPPIVLTYLAVTALSVAGFWQADAEMAAARKQILDWLLPALMFLLLVNCDMKAILALGPRILLGFACAAVSILLAFLAVFALLRGWLPADSWQVLSSVSGGWIGGTANMVAVSQAVGIRPESMANALITDALCYAVWVLVLFASVPLQTRFNQRNRSVVMADMLASSVRTGDDAGRPPDSGLVLIWLGLGLLVGNASHAMAAALPASPVLSTGSWTMMLATGLGLAASFTPLRRLAGSMAVSNALLAVVVAALASGADFSGMGQAPLYILCGFLVLGIHALLMLAAARLFKFDLALCGIASLANIGGVASAPLLAATYSPVLAPVGVLLAMLGYLLGTGGGLLLARIFQMMGV
ncbi:DUF819 family protein [Arenimonas sp. GDDSR-1]|uniref:DUF819 family protein n=1 Tax=Arenimonas sp. GDDSR-1 TaxID=2950125 RepID=UPI00262E1A64|nr:DUF819 family protein [Arenimonas sp. GDDSR-1]